MPANLTPQYMDAEKRFKQAETLPEKIAALEEELRDVWASLAQEESILEVYVEEEAILKTTLTIS